MPAERQLICTCLSWHCLHNQQQIHVTNNAGLTEQTSGFKIVRQIVRY